MRSTVANSASAGLPVVAFANITADFYSPDTDAVDATDATGRDADTTVPATDSTEPSRRSILCRTPFTKGNAWARSHANALLSTNR
jgi:hypothetical protein